MKTIFEYLLGKNNNAKDPLGHIKFEFTIDDGATDIFDPNDQNTVAEFKEQFLEISPENLKKIQTIKLIIMIKMIDFNIKPYAYKYRFYLYVNSDEYFERWTYYAKENKFKDPESNFRRYYGNEKYRRTDVKQHIIWNDLIYTAIFHYR